MKSPPDCATSLGRARTGQRWALWLGAAGLCSLPMLGWAAVSLTEFQSGDPIVAGEVNDNFAALAGAVVELESFAFQDAAVSDVEACAFGDSPCAFADHFAVRITTTADTVVRYGLTGGDPVSGGGVRAYDNSDGTPGSVVAQLILQRQTAPAVSWDAIAAQEIRFDGGGAGGPPDFLLAVPCSAFSFVDSPPAGEHTYRISVFVEDIGNAFTVLELHECRAFASMEGRLAQ